MIYLAAVAWFAAGYASYVYWWTKQYDLDVGDAVVGVLIAACLGPLAWLAGWSIHGDHPHRRVLIRKRS